MIADVDPATARMLSIAAAREEVLYRDEDGDEWKVTLLHFRNRRARIRFANGRERTVDSADVRPVPTA